MLFSEFLLCTLWIASYVDYGNNSSSVFVHTIVRVQQSFYGLKMNIIKEMCFVFAWGSIKCNKPHYKKH